MLTLPPPDPPAEERSQALTRLIREEIAREGGTITFARFMDLALYAPELGYYQSESSQFGDTGDFATAPLLSPLFSRCLARQIGEVIERMGDVEILEVGAGDGTLAVGIMAVLAARDTLPRRYLILEKSTALRARQRTVVAARLPELRERFVWLNALPEPGFKGTILANELLDALPTPRFRIRDGEIRECRVARAGPSFVERLGSPNQSPLTQAVRQVEKDLNEPLVEGYRSEIPLPQAAWVGEMASRMAVGLLLLMDYGYPRTEYYHPQRCEGTLRCHYRHRVHDDPFRYPGLQDISVHVDFTALARAGEAAGLTLRGFTTQRDFLLSLGLLDELSGIGAESPGYRQAVQGVKRLILPDEMGDAVKIMGFSRGVDHPWRGFAGADLRGRL